MLAISYRLRLAGAAGIAIRGIAAISRRRYRLSPAVTGSAHSASRYRYAKPPSTAPCAAIAIGGLRSYIALCVMQRSGKRHRGLCPFMAQSALRLVSGSSRYLPAAFNAALCLSPWRATAADAAIDPFPPWLCHCDPRQHSAALRAVRCSLPPHPSVTPEPVCKMYGGAKWAYGHSPSDCRRY